MQKYPHLLLKRKKREYRDFATLHHEAGLHHQPNSAAQDVHHALAPPIKCAAHEWGSETSPQCRLRLHCPQAFLLVDFQSRDVVAEVTQTVSGL